MRTLAGCFAVFGSWLSKGIFHVFCTWYGGDACAQVIICVTLLLPVTYFVVYITGTKGWKLPVQIKIVKLYIYKSLTEGNFFSVLGYRFSRVLGGGVVNMK